NHHLLSPTGRMTKMIPYTNSGAIIAAPTTSLPEEISGVRNWDYRYCWLRDASLTLYALATLGYGGEATGFAHFMKRVCRCRPDVFQILYGICVGADLDDIVQGL